MAATKLVTLANLQSYDALIKQHIATEDAKSLHTVLYDTSAKKIKFYKKENASLSDTADYSIDLPDDLTGSAAIASVDNDGIVTIKGGITEEDGIISNTATATAADVTLAKAATTGAAADITVADSGNNFTAVGGVKTVETALAQLGTQVTHATAAGAVIVEKRTGNNVLESANVAEYDFYQGVLPTDDAATKESKKITSVTIAKDMVATSGSLVQPTAQDPITIDGNQVTSGTYIAMTIANGNTFYINVADLIEYNTFTNSSSTGEILVTDNNHAITLSVGDILATKLTYKAAVAGVGEEGDPDYVAPAARVSVSGALDDIYTQLTNLGGSWEACETSDITALFTPVSGG